ncbi:MAG: methyl-coenzyme M reductase glutamine C-methyltransferase [Candidatus Methanospirareceae archaeon]
MRKRAIVISPGIYTYGAAVIAGILERGDDVDVTLSKSFNFEGRFDYIFLSLSSTLHLLEFADSIKWLRSRCEDGGMIVVGGAVSQCPEFVFRYLDCDAVVIGEGEIPVEMMRDGYGIDEIDGIAYREDDEVVINPPKQLPDIEDRTLPKIPKEIGKEDIRGANVYIETHRGCRFNCSFCQVPKFFGREIRSRCIDNIMEEVKEFKHAGVKKIAISGGTSTLYYKFPDLLESVSSVIGKNNLSAPDIRVDTINDEVLDTIREYTIGWVFFGMESGSDRMLKRMRKGIKVKDIIEAREAAKEKGVKVAGSFIVGYPGEREEDYEETKELVEDLWLDDCFISIAEPIPGTELAEEVIKGEEENPLFIESERIRNISVAEERALDLMLTSYLAREKPLLLSDELYEKTLKEVRKQGEDIRKVTEMITGGLGYVWSGL